MPTQPLSISENLLGVSEGIFVVSKLDAALQRTLVEAPAPCRSAFWVGRWSCNVAGKNEEVTIANRRSFVVNDHRMRQNCGGVCRGWAGLVADGPSWRKEARWNAADGLETLLGTCDIHDCMLFQAGSISWSSGPNSVWHRLELCSTCKQNPQIWRATKLQQTVRLLPF